MKKFIYAAAFAIAVSAVSCTSGTQEAQDKGAELKAKIENCTDPDSLKIYVQQAQDYAQKLIAEGKDAEAKAYLEEVNPIVEKKDPSALQILAAEADTAITAIKERAEAAKDSIEAKASEAKDSVKSKASKAVDAAKDAKDKAVDKAKDVANKTADKVKDLTGSKSN